MPRYFFHIQDGCFDPDTIGTVLPDIYAAHVAAVRTSGEMLRDKGLKFWDDGAWAMKVHDDADRPLFTLQVAIEEHGDLGQG